MGPWPGPRSHAAPGLNALYLPFEIGAALGVGRVFLDIHLDPLGGLSGDMFVAALLDAFPEHWPHVQSTIASLQLGEEGECKLAPRRDHSFVGRRFLVGTDRTASNLPGGWQQADSHGDPSHSHEGRGHHEHSHAHESRGVHRAWADIRAELDRSGLDDDVKKHALALFNLLAEAEAKVHGVKVDSVTFHEVGAVDSIVDIVAAAQLISLIRADRWTSAPLPIGSGRINSAHGVLPIPAPAAALLLQGLPVIDDGVLGERVTPTGAALVRARLAAVLSAIDGPLAVAVSGGVDSVTLATFAHRAAGSRAEVFHAVSPAVPEEATERVKWLATNQGWRLRIVDAREFVDENYLANPVDRCFFCKTNLYGCIARHSDAQILSGANLDDLEEYRPGLNAAKLHSVRHPYLEAKIDKRAVRSLARDLGLGALSELPAAPCLSSRVETGIAIRPEVLKAIHAVEQSIAKEFPAGIVRCRVRAEGVVIELDPETLAAIAGKREDEVRANADRIFAGIAPTLDLSFQPYRNGSAFVHSRA
jgi:pyridinium-3,5-biscarboxylic acid mononucleotide sulfurtransferase